MVVKSLVCMSLALGYGINDPGVGQNSQTEASLNSIRVILNNEFPDQRDAQSAAPEGFWTSVQKRNSATAARLNGILEFKRNEGSDAQNERYTRAMTFPGDGNIRSFFKTFRNNLEYAVQVEKKFLNIHMWKQNFAQFVVLAYSTASGLFTQMSQEFQNPNETTWSKFVALAVIELYLSQDLWVQRLFKMDLSTLSQVEQIEKMLESREEEYWGILSKNFQIGESVQQNFVAGNLRTRFDDLVEFQAIESASLFDRFIHGMRDYLKAGWMGIDLIVHKRRGEEPELTLVIRGQRKRAPSFAKKPVRVPITEQNLQPGLVPER